MNAASASIEVEPLLRQEDTSVPGVRRGRLALDRDVHLPDRVRARDAPVRTHREHGSRGSKRAERVLPAPPLSEERDRQDVHLIVVGGPQRLGVGGDVQLPEARDVVRVDDLDVSDVGPRVGRTVRASSGLHGIEGRAHRPVADRVEVGLEAERVQLRDPAREPVRVDLEQAAVVCRAAVAVAVRLEHRAGEVLEDAVHHQLDARRRVPPDGRRAPTLHELLDLLGAAADAPTTGHPRRGRSARRATASAT